MNSIVIGSGFGGIAAALRLRAKGHDVTLIEKHQDLGGRARVFKRNGFTFDGGPTVITAPYLINELFELFKMACNKTYGVSFCGFDNYTYDHPDYTFHPAHPNNNCKCEVPNYFPETSIGDNNFYICNQEVTDKIFLWVKTF